MYSVNEHIVFILTRDSERASIVKEQTPDSVFTTQQLKRLASYLVSGPERCAARQKRKKFRKMKGVGKFLAAIALVFGVISLIFSLCCWPGRDAWLIDKVFAIIVLSLVGICLGGIIIFVLCFVAPLYGVAAHYNMKNNEAFEKRITAILISWNGMEEDNGSSLRWISRRLKKQWIISYVLNNDQSHSASSTPTIQNYDMEDWMIPSAPPSEDELPRYSQVAGTEPYGQSHIIDIQLKR